MASVIGMGEFVWVTQGRTDHMATYVGDIRTNNNNNKVEDDVLIKWTSTNLKEYVPCSSVRLAMLNQRRRRVVVTHYNAAPAPPSRGPPSGGPPRGQQQKQDKQSFPPPREVIAVASASSSALSSSSLSISSKNKKNNNNKNSIRSMSKSSKLLQDKKKVQSLELVIPDRQQQQLQQIKLNSQPMERQMRRTSDGCLFPKGGKEQYLLEDGTYDMPKGARPRGLCWDKIRGMWVPSAPGPIIDNCSINNKNNDDNNDDNENKKTISSWMSLKLRHTSDGCLHPKGGKEKYLLLDGTYDRPKGKQPFGLSWNKIQGLWVPSERILNEDEDTKMTPIGLSTTKTKRFTVRSTMRSREGGSRTMGERKE